MTMTIGCLISVITSVGLLRSGNTVNETVVSDVAHLVGDWFVVHESPVEPVVRSARPWTTRQQIRSIKHWNRPSVKWETSCFEFAGRSYSSADRILDCREIGHHHFRIVYSAAGRVCVRDVEFADGHWMLRGRVYSLLLEEEPIGDFQGDVARLCSARVDLVTGSITLTALGARTIVSDHVMHVELLPTVIRFEFVPENDEWIGRAQDGNKLTRFAAGLDELKFTSIPPWKEILDEVRRKAREIAPAASKSEPTTQSCNMGTAHREEP
jgi:hypothetical protein